MRLVTIIVCLSVVVGTSYGRLSKDQLRQALGRNPMFSHQRERAVPVRQNVNIELPVTDPDVQPPKKHPSAKVRPTMAGGRIGGIRVPVQQNRRVQPVAAGKPVRQQEMVLGKIKPTRISKPQPVPVPSRPVVSNGKRPSASVASTKQQSAKDKQECAFHIPSFLLPNPRPGNIGSTLKCPSFLLPGPDINPELVNLMVAHWFTGASKQDSAKLNDVKRQITQVEFEQKCLIPALRAHVLGGAACKTRELKVYLEWLLYLRKRLFNI